MQTIRKAGLTFAPEAGTQRLRDVINKNVTEEDLLRACGDAFSAGWTSVKLYFMLGLPTETDEDILGIAELCRKVSRLFYELPKERRGKGLRLSASASTFVPKPFTPFQWAPQVPLEEIRRRQQLLRDALRGVRGVEFHCHLSQLSVLEAAFSRGDRRLADVLENGLPPRLPVRFVVGAFPRAGVAGGVRRARPDDGGVRRVVARAGRAAAVVAHRHAGHGGVSRARVRARDGGQDHAGLPRGLQRLLWRPLCGCLPSIKRVRRSPSSRIWTCSARCSAPSGARSCRCNIRRASTAPAALVRRGRAHGRNERVRVVRGAAGRDGRAGGLFAPRGRRAACRPCGEPGAGSARTGGQAVRTGARGGLPHPPDGRGADPGRGASEALEALLAGEILVNKRTKGGTRPVDIRPQIMQASVEDAGDGGVTLHVLGKLQGRRRAARFVFDGRAAGAPGRAGRHGAHLPNGHVFRRGRPAARPCAMMGK